jgi:hypothetical protein
MKLILFLAFSVSSLSTWAQPQYEIDYNKITKTLREKRYNELEEYKRKNPRYNNLDMGYLELQIKLENEEYEQIRQTEMHLCQKYKHYCYSKETNDYARRRTNHSIGIDKLYFYNSILKDRKEISDLESDRRIDVAWIQSSLKECKEYKNLCDNSEPLKRYKLKYGKSFDSNEKIEIPSMDALSAMVQGKNSVNALSDEITIKSREVQTRNLNANSCRWSEDFPRRLVEGPGCNSKGNKICVGYVVCERARGEGKFVRMSTCSESNCGANDAVACTKQLNYKSAGPSEETRDFLSESDKAILRGRTSAQ